MQACGPLYSWVASQIGYSEIYNSVLPLREEVERLETEAAEAVTRKTAVEAEVEALEESIMAMKADYADLIRSVESIKGEMAVVSVRVERSENLLESLRGEKASERASERANERASERTSGNGYIHYLN